MEQARFYFTIGSEGSFSTNESSFPSEQAIFDSVAADLENAGLFGDEGGVDVDVYEVRLVGRYRIHVDTKRVMKRRAAPKKKAGGK